MSRLALRKRGMTSETSSVYWRGPKKETISQNFHILLRERKIWNGVQNAFVIQNHAVAESFFDCRILTPFDFDAYRIIVDDDSTPLGSEETLNRRPIENDALYRAHLLEEHGPVF